MRNSSPVALGEIIAEKYQVEGVLGEGGMGLVVSAWHLGLRQRVAIKLLLTNGPVLEAAAVERFQREARAAARIRSDHVCRVLDVGTLSTGIPYLVMEYLEGCDLSDELARRGRLPHQEAITYVLEACEALAEAHMAGIIHRDLKPANLFLARRSNGTRCLKLLDFGVSKSIADSSTGQFSLTKTSALVGSPIYMSPEQLNSAKDVDARTDIWALGALLYELITGRTPFYGESIAQLVSAVLNTTPPTFAELGISAPGGLEAVVAKALEKPRDKRFSSIGELATALGPFAPDGSISVSRILRVRPTSGNRDPLPETRDDQHQQKQRTPTDKTPKSGGRAKVPSTFPPRAAAKRKLSGGWGWALLALLLIGFAGVLATVVKKLTNRVERDVSFSPAESRDAGTRVSAAASGAVLTANPPPPPQVVPAPPAQPTLAPAPAPVALSQPSPAEPAKPDGGARAASTLPTGRAQPRPRPIARPRSEVPASDLPNFGGRR